MDSIMDRSGRMDKKAMEYFASPEYAEYMKKQDSIDEVETLTYDELRKELREHGEFTIWGSLEETRFSFKRNVDGVTIVGGANSVQGALVEMVKNLRHHLMNTPE